MMTTALIEVARQLVAHPKWQRASGLMFYSPAGHRYFRRLDRAEWIDVATGVKCATAPSDIVPDLDDPLTAAWIQVLGRTVLGAPYACSVGGKASGWAVWRSAGDYAAWQAGDNSPESLPLTGLSEDGVPLRHPSEVEAWVAAILRGA